MLRPQHSPGWRAAAEIEDAAVRLAGVGERLALDEGDAKQPLAPADIRQPDRPTLAVVEDVRGFVDQQVVKAALRAELLRGHVAGHLLAQTKDLGRVLREKFCTEACEVEICDVPGRLEPARLSEHGVDSDRRKKDNRAPRT